MMIAELESARTKNTQFISGCHKVRMRPGNADIICSAMKLPIPFVIGQSKEISLLLTRSLLERRN